MEVYEGLHLQDMCSSLLLQMLFYFLQPHTLCLIIESTSPEHIVWGETER